MLRTVGFVIKAVLFSVFVIWISNWVRWDGKTVSEHVMNTANHIEKSNITQQARTWARKITVDAREGVAKKSHRHNEVNSDRTETEAAAPSRSEDQIPSSERQKLRELIRELNHSRTQD
ncbi:hypothetical protein WDW37_12765 [Bdellovibrionota bacterium FG-1]